MCASCLVLCLWILLRESQLRLITSDAWLRTEPYQFLQFELGTLFVSLYPDPSSCIQTTCWTTSSSPCRWTFALLPRDSRAVLVSFVSFHSYASRRCSLLLPLCCSAPPLL